MAPPNSPAVVSLRFVGANRNARIEGLDRQRGVTNYLIGRDPSKWRRRVPTYARVRYSSIYPGIDLVYYGVQGQLEYDLVVAPEADLDRIRFAIDSSARPTMNRAGDLVLDRNDRVILRKPRVYQETAAGRREIEGRFRMLGPSTVGFEVASYDHRRPLVIDPTVLTYSSYLGGVVSLGRGIAVDSSGAVYVTGWTGDMDDLPTRSPNPNGPYQANLNTGGAGIDAFVAKFDTAVSGDGALIYSTYLGGSGTDAAFAIAVDGSGDAYVTGFTDSSDFPLVNAAIQTVAGCPPTCYGGSYDAFVTELLPDGSGLVTRVSSAGAALISAKESPLIHPTTPTWWG